MHSKTIILQWYTLDLYWHGILIPQGQRICKHPDLSASESKVDRNPKLKVESGLCMATQRSDWWCQADAFDLWSFWMPDTNKGPGWWWGGSGYLSLLAARPQLYGAWPQLATCLFLSGAKLGHKKAAQPLLWNEEPSLTRSCHKNITAVP